MSRLRERRGLDVNIRSEAQMREYRAIADRIAADRPGGILDWGCGLPLERFPEITAHRSPDPVLLPFDDNAFDAVLSLGVLEHVAQPHESLEELKRVLVPRGTLYVYKLPNRYSYLERLAKVLGLYYHGAEPHDAVYTKRSALELMGAHGFEVREFRRSNMLPLTLTGSLATTAGGAIWAANRGLARIPGPNLLSTNLELVATAPA
jgi:SAM-dependent methyltransferase